MRNVRQRFAVGVRSTPGILPAIDQRIECADPNAVVVNENVPKMIVFSSATCQFAHRYVIDFLLIYGRPNFF